MNGIHPAKLDHQLHLGHRGRRPRDLYVRGKYRDVVLPMTVLRRLDAVLEPSQPTVLQMKANLDESAITNQGAALRQAAGQAFYNASPFTLRHHAQANSGAVNARIEHDKALGLVLIGLMKDDTEPFRQYSDNDSFRR